MLVKYECLKILRKRSTCIVMAISLILTGFLFGLPIIQYQIYNQDGVIKGTAGIAYEKGQYAALSVLLSEDYVRKTIREVRQLFQHPENIGYDGNERFLTGDAYWNGVAPREKLLNLIADSYSAPNEPSSYNHLPELNMKKGAFFYKTIHQKRETLLQDPSRNLSHEQKEYWRSMASKVDTPLRYGYYGGWETIVSSFELLVFALLSICIVIAPVFSGEYQAGTDAVILSGKYGKTKLITAKIAASLLFGTIAFLVHVAVAYGLPLAAFGADGWDLPLQIANTVIPYPFTFLQAVLVNTGIIYLVLLAMMGLTLFLSAKMKSPYLVVILLVPLLFIPMFLSPNGTTGAYNLTLFLLPYRSVMPEFSKYISYQLGSLAFDPLTARAVLYAVLAIVTLPLARLGFKKHQVT